MKSPNKLYIEKLCLFVGIPLHENHRTLCRAGRVLWFCYAVAAQIFIILQLLGLAIEMYFYYSDLDVLFSGSITLVYCSQITLKMLLFASQSSAFSRIFDEMASLSRQLSAEEEYLKLEEPRCRLLNKFGRTKVGTEVASISCYILLLVILSFVLGTDKLKIPVRIWAPFNFQQNPLFTVTSLFELCSFASAVARTSAIDLVFLNLLIIPAGQLKYLRLKLDRIFADVDSNDKMLVGSDRPLVTMEEQFKWWMRKHQQLLRMFEDMKPLCSHFLLLEYASVMAYLFLAGMILTSSDEYWEAYKRFMLVFLVGIHLVQLYLLALSADILGESETSVAEGAMTSTLFRASRNLRRGYLAVLARSRKAMAFTSGGVNPLSSKTFSLMLRVTLSYFVTVLQVKQRFSANAVSSDNSDVASA